MPKVIEIKSCQECYSDLDFYPSGCPLSIPLQYKESPIHPNCPLPDKVEFPSEEEIELKIKELTGYCVNFTDTSVLYSDELGNSIEAYSEENTAKTLANFANWLKSKGGKG
jgi:hypothetical protein